jgi:hypothetical protein
MLGAAPAWCGSGIPSTFRDPIALLCDRAGGLGRSAWRTGAPGEPFRAACP